MLTQCLQGACIAYCPGETTFRISQRQPGSYGADCNQAEFAQISDPPELPPLKRQRYSIQSLVLEIGEIRQAPHTDRLHIFIFNLLQKEDLEKYVNPFKLTGTIKAAIAHAIKTSFDRRVENTLISIPIC